MNKCKECNKLKDCRNFYSINKVVCKDCIKKRTVLWQENNPERLKLIQARRRAKPEYKKKQAKFYREWYDKNGRQRRQGYKDIVNLWKRLNPEKWAVYHEITQAVRSGKIKKPTHCSKCGSGRKIVGHHNDYKLPLEVEWLCYSCHKKVEH